jgi:hypothetical protein
MKVNIDETNSWLEKFPNAQLTDEKTNFFDQFILAA